jgi:spermidine synthase
MGARGRALRVDGSLASWYAPGSAITGSVWDALAAPLLALPPSRRRSVLILGLGGGSAARVVRALAPAAQIVGVERDQRVLRAARRWFDLDDLGVRVVEADALLYLRRAKRRFDAVLEDVFVGRGRAVHKPAWLPAPGLELAARRLARGGVLASNGLDEFDSVAREMRRLFPATLRIGVEGYDNRIAVGSTRQLDARRLRSSVAADATLAPTAARLSFRTGARRLRGRLRETAERRD